MIEWKLGPLMAMALLSVFLYEQCTKHPGKSLPCSLLSCGTACCSIVRYFLPSIVCVLLELTAVLIVEQASSFVLSRICLLGSVLGQILHVWQRSAC